MVSPNPPAVAEPALPAPPPAADPAVAWDDRLLRNPHAVADKQRRVRQMFAAIAPSYDLNNRVHSLWVDQHWRRRAVKLSDLKPTDRVVDVACGTGYLTLKYVSELSALSFLATKRFAQPAQVVGIDFTWEMLPLARRKAVRDLYRPSCFDDPHEDEMPDELNSVRAKLALSECTKYQAVRFLNGDAQALPLPDACCDVVSIAFGIRNVADPAKAIGEFFRVLRPGGRLVVLEFSLPTNRVLRGLYNFYFRQVLPRTATLLSGDKTGAYKYLPESVNTFVGRGQMTDMMSAAGFADVTPHPMTFGVCVCYRGLKR